jgi:hypothetical protein
MGHFRLVLGAEPLDGAGVDDWWGPPCCGWAGFGRFGSVPCGAILDADGEFAGGGTVAAFRCWSRPLGDPGSSPCDAGDSDMCFDSFARTAADLERRLINGFDFFSASEHVWRLLLVLISPHQMQKFRARRELISGLTLECSWRRQRSLEEAEGVEKRKESVRSLPRASRSMWVVSWRPRPSASSRRW